MGAHEGSEAPWKKAKLELLTKHGSSETSDTREIQQFRCLCVAAADPLQWWKSQTVMYKCLSHLAHIVMATSATSAPFESIFSLAGSVISAESSALSPHVVDKVLFVHENIQYA